MPNRKTDLMSANLMINVFDGTRRPIPGSVKIFVRIIDGNQRKWYANYRKGPNHLFKGLPVFDNLGDNYTVVVSAKGFHQAGFTPIKIARGTSQHIDLMLLPVDGTFNFNAATWDALRRTDARLHALLRAGIETDEMAKERYDTLRENQPEILAAFLNLTTAMQHTYLPEGTPADYLKELIWDQIQQDRFFAYADKELLGQLERATEQGLWKIEVGSAVLHPGATKSFKQVQFGEANVQVTFHEGDRKRINAVPCVKVESDMDYYRDILAHALLEVLPNTLGGRKTDPRTIYALRWIAGRHAGVPEFDPPYTIA